MANRFGKYFRHKPYSFQEIMGQIVLLKSTYAEVEYKVHKDHRTVSVYMKIQPTAESIKYTLRIECRVERSYVNIFVVDPVIGKEFEGKSIPHMYNDGSLCLFYPEYREWKYTDAWAETLIPWASLWLYYFELWKFTGEWLGGGIHGEKTKSDK